MSFKLSIGADPETFVRNIKTGEFVSAHTLIPGTKTEPYKVPYGAIQVDGVAAEFNIDPAENNDQFVSYIESVKAELQKRVGGDYELVCDPAVVFPEEYFKSLPESVRELGCNPDFNAWTGQVNEKPNGNVTTMRTGAGHIHIGWTKDVDPTDDTHFNDCRIVAKQLDYYLGLYSLMWDQDTERRKLYGRAGSFRPKPYGVEYRPLSNVWVTSPKLQSWIYTATYKACHDLIVTGIQIEDNLGDVARDVIDTSQVWWKPTSSGGNDTLYKKLGSLSQSYTGLNPPPALPKKTKPGEEKEVQKPEVKKSIYKKKVEYLHGVPVFTENGVTSFDHETQVIQQSPQPTQPTATPPLPPTSEENIQGNLVPAHLITGTNAFGNHIIHNPELMNWVWTGH